MERISQSFRLVRQSYRILVHDSELVFLPFIAGIITLALLVAVALSFGLSDEGIRELRIDHIVPLLLLYIVAHAIAMFFQAAVIAGATERLRGGDPTIRSAVAAAAQRMGSIVMWSVVAGTVGMILDAIHEISGWLGKILTALVGITWSLATLLVLPVLVLERHSVGDSFNRASALFAKTWGDAVEGRIGIGLAAFLIWMSLGAVVWMLLTLGLDGASFIVAFTGGIFLLVFFAALQGVFVAALYNFATVGERTAGFDHELLANAFVPK